MSGEVLLARNGDIATVTLSNPGRMNALDLAMWERLGLLAKELQNDESLRCVVVLQPAELHRLLVERREHDPIHFAFAGSPRHAF